MKQLELKNVEHKHKAGNRCKYIEPNINEDTLFMENGEVIGFYKKNLTGKVKKLLELTDYEFRSKNVPKAMLKRSNVLTYTRKGMSNKQAEALATVQMSAILGSMLPKPQMKRNYPCTSSVHQHKSANNFVKAMLLLNKEAGKLIKKYLPETHERQKDLVKENVPKKWRFGELFTGSISNYNISAPFHQDNLNMKGGVNAIYTTRNNATGGCLNVPDYDATIEMANNSICVYPAWKNLHGVTPIQCEDDKSYRNTHIFYLLNGFQPYG